MQEQQEHQEDYMVGQQHHQER